MSTPPGFASRLIWWRRRRGLSQLQLALAADCSQRHVSFLELGRTRPSREMVLRLAAALDVPLRSANELMLAAGYAPVWSETELGAPALGPIRDALGYILSQQEPYPAVVVDRVRRAVSNSRAIPPTSFSVGITERPAGHTSSLRELLDEADWRMYQDKSVRRMSRADRVTDSPPASLQ